MLIWVKCGLGFRFKLIANFASFFGYGTGGHIRASRFTSRFRTDHEQTCYKAVTTTCVIVCVCSH